MADCFITLITLGKNRGRTRRGSWDGGGVEASPPTHDWLWVSELMVVAEEVGRAGDQLGVRVGSK